MWLERAMFLFYPDPRIWHARNKCNNSVLKNHNKYKDVLVIGWMLDNVCPVVFWLWSLEISSLKWPPSSLEQPCWLGSSLVDSFVQQSPFDFVGIDFFKMGPKSKGNTPTKSCLKMPSCSYKYITPLESHQNTQKKNHQLCLIVTSMRVEV